MPNPLVGSEHSVFVSSRFTTMGPFAGRAAKGSGPPVDGSLTWGTSGAPRANSLLVF